jgi:hypothetical protein
MSKKSKRSKESRQLENDFAKIITGFIILSLIGYWVADDATKQTINYYITAGIGLAITVTITYFIHYLCNKHKKQRSEEIQRIIEKNKRNIEKQQNETQNKPTRNLQSEVIIRQRTETIIRQQTEIYKKQDTEKWINSNTSGDFHEKQNYSGYEPQNLIQKYKPQIEYEKTQPETTLLTNAEDHFMGYLIKVTPQYLKINCKTRLADAISNDILDKSVHKFRILQMHLDFILIDKSNKIVLAIELDDASHYTTENRERDRIKNKILEKAKIPLLRFPVAKYYNLIELKNSIETKIKKPPYS